MSSDLVLKPTQDTFAEKLRGFGPIGVLTMVVLILAGPMVEPLGALLVLLWAYRSHTPWAEIGFSKPRSWMITVLLGIALGMLLKLAMKSLVLPLFGAPALNPRYQYLVGNAAAMPNMIFDVVVGAGFGEETVYRGYLFERFGKLFRGGRWAKLFILLVSSFLFAIIHYPNQGTYGALQAFFTGLTFGALYLITKSLWLSMVTHAVFDLTALFIIYRNLEAQVAHLIFK